MWSRFWFSFFGMASVLRNPFGVVINYIFLISFCPHWWFQSSVGGSFPPLVVPTYVGGSISTRRKVARQSGVTGSVAQRDAVSANTNSASVNHPHKLT